MYDFCSWMCLTMSYWHHLLKGNILAVISRNFKAKASSISEPLQSAQSQKILCLLHSAIGLTAVDPDYILCSEVLHIHSWAHQTAVFPCPPCWSNLYAWFHVLVYNSSPELGLSWIHAYLAGFLYLDDGSPLPQGLHWIIILNLGIWTACCSNKQPMVGSGPPHSAWTYWSLIFPPHFSFGHVEEVSGYYSPEIFYLITINIHEQMNG